MDLLKRLKKRVEEWKDYITKLEKENNNLISKNRDLIDKLNQNTNEINSLKEDRDILQVELKFKEEKITLLSRELEAKNIEIEAIIEKVEVLLK